MAHPPNEDTLLGVSSTYNQSEVSEDMENYMVIILDRKDAMMCPGSSCEILRRFFGCGLHEVSPSKKEKKKISHYAISKKKYIPDFKPWMR